MTKGSQALADFKGRYSSEPPKFPTGRRESECKQITGFQLLSDAPAKDIQPGFPPLARNEYGTNTYIWVIDSKGLPYIIEAGIHQLGWQLPKHTNLTGEGDAYVGGQLWFKTDLFLYISGGSGRYPPSCEQQLEDVVRVFKAFRYEVRSLGWKKDSGPLRHLEEP
jgi:hypothetical protein